MRHIAVDGGTRRLAVAGSRVSATVFLLSQFAADPPIAAAAAHER
jgi:hypothetical protein